MLIQDLNVVLKVAEFRSITKAATSLDMQIATASAAVKRVEKSLGIELFVRTTRSLRLSSAGERYLPNCAQALTMLDLAKQNVKEDLDVVEGDLRIALSSDLGRNLVIPWLDEFMDQHAKISLKVHISDSNIDFYRDPIDLALRYGAPKEASVFGFKICDIPRVTCASPTFLAKHGIPQHPNDLTSFNGVFYQLNDLVKDVWEFTQNGHKFKVKISGNRVTNDADLVRRWCISGKGIAVKSALDMSSHLLSGEVVSVIPEFKPTPTELWLVCPSRQSISPAVRLLRDMFKVKCVDLIKQLTEQGVFVKSL